MSAAARALAAVLLVLALAGCGGESARGVTDSGRLQAQWVDLPDGRVVLCVSGGRYTARAISCDWANAAREGEAP